MNDDRVERFDVLALSLIFHSESLNLASQRLHAQFLLG
jgi:hypothetical protein